MSFGTYQLEYGDLILELSEEHKKLLEGFSGIEL